MSMLEDAMVNPSPTEPPPDPNERVKRGPGRPRLMDTPRVTTFKLDQSHIDKITTAARESGHSRSQVIRDLIDEHLGGDGQSA